MRFGIAFQSNKQPAEYIALAQTVDRYPFAVVSVYNDLLFQPAIGPLLWMAPHLHHATLGPAALNPYTLHPIEIAGQMALLDMATQGRAYLGLVRGAWLSSLGLSQSSSVARLRETASFIKHVLARRPDAFAGRFFRLKAGATLRYTPLRGEVPLTIGTWGLETARMAQDIADELKIGGSANPGMVSYLRQATTLPICLGAVTVIDNDAAAARVRARRELALYLPIVAKLDPTVDDEDLAAEDLPDPLLDRFAFAGDATAIIRQVEALAAAGASRVEFGTPHGLGNACDAIALLGERVLPHFIK